MWLLIKTAWRNLFRQSRRTLITVSAMSVSLILAIPTYGLMEGLKRDMYRGITGMELGHLQVHDPAYPRGKALQSTLSSVEQLLATIRATEGVKAASPRVHGFALASHDQEIHVTFSPLDHAESIRFGREVDAKAPWRQDHALSCEVLAFRRAASRHGLSVGTVLTPAGEQHQGRCERLRIVGLLEGEAKGKKGIVTLRMPQADIDGVFPGLSEPIAAVIKHAAALSLYGVDPRHERDVSFMPEKVIEGRYLGHDPKGELVVGYRLAKTLKLKVGSKLFVQAGALDQTQGSFYRDFSVVGIYRTGVDFIDRSRVFLHVKDAQAVMTLGDRVHEVVVIGPDPANPRPLLERLERRIHSELVIVANGAKKRGRRAGSEPLDAPLTVYEPARDGAKLLIPYDLKRRFEDIEGLQGVARRVYGRVTIRKDVSESTLRFAGVEGVYEKRLSALDKKLSAGSYLPRDADDERWPLLLSERAAQQLDAKVGDRLTVRARDEDGNAVDQQAEVRGLIASARWPEELPEVVLPYYLAQQVDARRLNARAHELLLLPRANVAAATIEAEAAKRLQPLVRSWRQIAPDMAKLLETQDVWAGIFLLIIFAIAAMTVMNTMLMAVFERTREFGVLKSLGMRPRQVFALIVFETVALAILAAIIGGGIGVLLNHWAVVDGIDFTKWTSGFTYQGTFIDPVWRSLHTVKAILLPIVMVMAVCLLVSFYPAARAGRLKPVDALRHHN